MMFWSDKNSLLKCIRLCTSPLQYEVEQDCEGRMHFMNKKLDKSVRELIERNKSTEIKATENIKSLEDRFTSVEKKIEDVNQKFPIILSLIYK